MNQINSKLFLLAIATAFLFGTTMQMSASAQAPDVNQVAEGAQDAAKSELLSVTVVNVKPEMLSYFQKFIREETNPGLRKGGAKWRDVWQLTGVAGNPYEYLIVAPIDNFAYFDGPSQLEKGLGQKAYPAWINVASRLVTSVRRFVIRTRPDLTNYGKRTGPPKLAVAVSTIVAAGRGKEFEAFLKNDYLPLVKRADATYLVGQTIFGGDVNEYHSLTFRETFAELDKGPIAVQMLGEDGAAALMQKLPTGVVVRQERTLMRFVPELSIVQQTGR